MRAKLGMKRPEEVTKLTMRGALTSEQLALQEETERRGRLEQSKFVHTDMPSKEYMDSYSVTSAINNVEPLIVEIPEEPKLPTGKAIYNYSAVGHIMSNGDVDISIVKGEICKIVSPPIMGWIKIEVNGTTGLVPENYIIEITNEIV